MFIGPAAPAQFDNWRLWRKKRPQQVPATPEVPEPRRDNDEIEPEALDLYALSVGRTTGS